jgi:1-acyl-sn-glycerol-3-phosphate acyltransferase
VERPAPERKVGLDYDHEWSRRYPARLLRAAMLDSVTRPLAHFIAPATIRGDEHLRHLEAPVIFAANHASHLDTPLLLTTLPTRFRHRTVVGAAADYFFDRRWKATLWSLALAAIPIERSRVNRRSAEIATDLLKDKWNLVIFPEGGRTSDGWAQEFRGGAAYLAVRSGAPVVPVYLHGTRRILPKRDDEHPGGSGTENKGSLLRRAEVIVMFGPPLVAHEGEDARRFGVRIERAVDLLAREVATDWWTARHVDTDAPSSLRGPDAVPWRRAWALGAPGTRHGEPPWPEVPLTRLTKRRPPERTRAARN